MKLYQKLIKAKAEFPSIVKDVTAYGYKYANLAQVIEAISTPLWNNGLDFYQIIEQNHLKTGLIDCETGDKIELVDFELISVSIAKANEIQSFGAGITYLRRYALMLAFGLATEDDDGASAKQPVKQPTPKPPRPENDILIKLVKEKQQFLSKDNLANVNMIISNINDTSTEKLTQWIRHLETLGTKPADFN